MSVRLVVDASVALKWMTPEDDSEQALRVLDLRADLHAPAFIVMELANVLWLQVRAGKAEVAGARAALDELRMGPLRIWQGEEPLAGTIALAAKLDHAVYDCAYLALAHHLDADYVTADRRFWRKAQHHAEIAGRVVLLHELVSRA